MTTTRSGSAVLFCLALATIAVMIGYAFLRTATRQTMSGKSEMLIALARDAAQSGLTHATEQILSDYNAPSLPIADHSGTIPVSSAPTFLDGPYRAPFVSLNRPNRLLYTAGDGKLIRDDASEENHLLLPNMLKREQNYAWWQEFDGRGIAGGNIIYDARGRYIEVNYHNTTRPDPSDPDPVPVNTLRFGDLSAAAPERSDGIFFDEHLHRLNTGTVEEKRQRARYRLRYAVGVEDLSGHLLSNPRANMNIDWKDPNNDYRNIPQWLEHANYAWDNMTSLWVPKRATSLRLGHLLKGRGSANNVDRAWTSGIRQGLPATFPLMFRQQPWNNWSGWHGWYGNFCYSNNNPPDPNMGGRLFYYPGEGDYPSIDATVAGGEVITPTGQSAWAPYSHALVGPQYSWFNQTFALKGTRVDNGRYDSNHDGYYASADSIGANSIILNTLTTPFGRRVESGGTGVLKWYNGNYDTPWQINLLTAPPQVINEMLLGYIPPYLKTTHYYMDQYYRKTGEVRSGVGGRDVTEIYDPNETLSKRQTNNGNGWDYSIPGLDLMTDQLGSGFTEFPAPSSINPNDGATIKPDYYQDVPEPRVVEERYPGPLVRGNSVNPDEGSDDLGKYIDADSAYGQGMDIGWCTHTYNPLMYQGGGDRTSYEEEGNNPVTKWKIIRRIDPKQFTYRYSYYYDLIRSMTTAISYARATWVQYPNTVFDPRDTSPVAGFNPATLRDPTAYDTIEKIDALFLRQLGENFSAPGTRCPHNPIISKVINKYITFSVNAHPVSHTIHSLVGDFDYNNNGALDPIDMARHINEDINGNGVLNPGEDDNDNGKLDPGEDRNPDGALGPGEDANGNGVLDPSEDSNHNFILDPGEDLNNNGTIDGDEDKGDGVLNSLIDTGHGVDGHERSKVMERMLNDFRMSYFGSSPKYRDFRPLDFNYDGKVHASCYPENPAATAKESTYKSTRWLDSDANGRGPAPAKNMYFSVTGCLFIGKSHFYRIWTRGEVYDNLLRKPVAQQTLETVLTVDPEAPLDPAPGRVSPENRVLFKEWHYNDTVSEMPLQTR